MIRPLPQLIAAWMLLCAHSALAQAAPASPKLPMPPLPSSPVDMFRKLLATNAAGREEFMAGKSPEIRNYLETKIREYEVMPVEQREARLQSLQLRWYMLAFMRMNPADRAPRLAGIPEPDQALIKQRLGLWDILPPPLRQDVLDNEMAIRLFVRSESSDNSTNILRAMTGGARDEMQRQYERWNALPADRKEQMIAHFKNFFELQPTDKNRTLSRLTDSERSQMEKTLTKFGGLPRDEREQAMQGFKKFAELSPVERAAFLKTAERWKTMTEKERGTWRNIVMRLQAQHALPLPPLPAIVRPQPDPSTLIVTNTDR